MLRVHLDRLADMVFTEKEAALATNKAQRLKVLLSCAIFDFAMQILNLIYLVLCNLTIRTGSLLHWWSNGVGKTTLAKIMLGLFQPTSGRVLSTKNLQRITASVVYVVRLQL